MRLIPLEIKAGAHLVAGARKTNSMRSTGLLCAAPHCGIAMLLCDGACFVIFEACRPWSDG